MYDMPAGVYLKSIVPNCAAEQAGLQKGDIITRFDGVSISSYEALRERLQVLRGRRDRGSDRTVSGRRRLYEKTVNVTLSTQAEVEQINKEGRMRRTAGRPEQVSRRRALEPGAEGKAQNPFPCARLSFYAILGERSKIHIWRIRIILKT